MDLKSLDENTLINRFSQAKHRLILLDYDGTLVDYAPTPEKAIPSVDLFEPLLHLSLLPNTGVFIITGRTDQDIDRFVGGLPVHIIAEHGAMIKEESGWEQMVTSQPRWKEPMNELLNKYVACCPGSFIEIKKFSLAWHYRNADEKAASNTIRDLLNQVNKLKEKYGLSIMEGNKVIELRENGMHKGIAVEHLLEKQEYDFILAIGDDKTDEDMFKALEHNDYSYTIKVGSGETFAKYRIQNVQQVIALLDGLQ